MNHVAPPMPISIRVNTVDYVVGPSGLRLSDALFVPFDGFATFGGAQVRALDFDASDVVLFFRGVPHIVPVRLANEEARRVAAEFGAALVPYAVPGTPAVLAPVSQFFLPKDHRAVGKVCPRCKSNDFEETAPAKWLRVAPRRCKACGTDYDPPTPVWKQVARATLDPRSWFGIGGWG